MSIKATCSVCGKQFDMPDKWQVFVEKYPERVKCNDCKNGKVVKKEEISKEAPKSQYEKKYARSEGFKKGSSTGKKEVTAQLFREAYNELIEEFSDIKKDVEPYLGGWVSTIVINRSK